MLSLFLPLFLFSLLFPAPSRAGSPLVGAWLFKNDRIEVLAEFLPDGTFRQTAASAQGKETAEGRYQLSGQMLHILPQGAPQPQQVICRFLDADTIAATYPSGETLQWRRLKGTAPQELTKAPPSRPGPTAKASPGPPSPLPGGKRPTLLMQRVWEPKEKSFSFLLPKGWKFQGGIFNVNPLAQNGPGNSIAPKCDLSVSVDDGGTVMHRWVPSWNYADLTYSPSGFSLFRPGQNYQGMLVKALPAPKQFLTELFQSTRPRAANVRIVAEDPMGEAVEALYRANRQLNHELQQMGLRPNRYEALALLLEYEEGGQRFREVLKTVIADARGSAFMWSNEHTVQFRAPAAEFQTWKPALDVIQGSVRLSPQWVAEVARALDQRGKVALETQQYVNKVLTEIGENRRRTHAGIRYENYLFITGQEEYMNPYTGETELDTSAYRHRWVNNHGDFLYTDEGTHNPNQQEKRPNYEWKRTPARPR